MSTSEVTVDRRSGLANVVDIIIAPNAAFERLRIVPTWGWAFLVALLLGVAGSLLMIPALVHAAQVSLPAKLAALPQIQRLPPDQQQSTIALQMKVTLTILQLYWLFVPIQLLIAALVQAVLMTAANAMGHGDGSFRKYFALSMLVSVIGVGIAALVIGIIVTIRGANSFEAQSAVMGSMPSLALLAPGVKGGLLGFLSALNVFSLWATALLALGMQRVGRIAVPIAWTMAIVMLLLTALLAAWGGAQNG